MGKSNQKIGKSHNYPSVRKNYSVSRAGVGGRKKTKTNNTTKSTTTLTYFDKLIKTQEQAKRNVSNGQSNIEDLATGSQGMLHKITNTR